MPDKSTRQFRAPATSVNLISADNHWATKPSSLSSQMYNTKGVHILGAGAIGLLHAHHIHRATQLPITLLLRSKAASQYEQASRTMQLSELSEEPSTSQLDHEVIPEPSFNTNPSPPMSTPNIDTLLVATKSYQTIPALTQLRSRLVAPPGTTNSVIVLIQNGKHIAEHLRQFDIGQSSFTLKVS